MRGKASARAAGSRLCSDTLYDLRLRNAAAIVVIAISSTSSITSGSGFISGCGFGNSVKTSTTDCRGSVGSFGDSSGGGTLSLLGLLILRRAWIEPSERRKTFVREL